MPLKKILQINHGYNAPFLDVANQFSSLFDSTEYEVTSLFLKGESSAQVQNTSLAQKNIFLNCSTAQLRGLKLSALWKLLKILRKDKYTMVIGHRYKAIYLACLASLFTPIPTIIAVAHAYGVFSSKSRAFFLSFFDKKLKILGVSQSIRDDIIQNLQRYGKFDVFSLPNSVDIDRLKKAHFPPTEAKKRLGIDSHTFLIATAGRLHPEKDQETLIRAFAIKANLMPNAQLLIFGTGQLKEDLHSLIDKLGMQGRIKLPGFIENLSAYYPAFDLFVLPSAIEPFGMVLIEAMAANVPVLSSKTGGGIEIIDDESMLFDIGSVNQLADKLVIIYGWNAEDRKQNIVRATRRVHSHFSQQAFKKLFWSLPFHNGN